MFKCYVFSAHWCGACRVLKKKLENFKDCEVIKYDVDEVEEDLLEKYKIRNIPVTILVNENEEEIKRWIGLFNVNEITEKIKEING